VLPQVSLLACHLGSAKNTKILKTKSEAHVRKLSRYITISLRIPKDPGHHNKHKTKEASPLSGSLGSLGIHQGLGSPS
jgi:hypothetical protein